jgi:LAS superfamily LD-carboxypeptidase LdcB
MPTPILQPRLPFPNGRMLRMEWLRTHTPIFALLLGMLVLAVIALSVLLYDAHSSVSASETDKRERLADASTALNTQTERINELEALLEETKVMLENAIEENEDLEDDLRDEKDRNDEFEDQIEKIGSTVGDLDKLSKTDEELLQKYSKVYFLNEHYQPPRLREIDDEFVYREGGDPEFIHSQVEPFLNDMLEDAQDDGVKLFVLSAFRSYDEQRELKGAYSVTYGSGANTFSADQGYSEHQLGTTIDFTTENLGGGLTGFETTPAYEWLTKNAHKYGFVLSYPKDNAYYIFEPWHWRFVGTKLARDLHSDGKFFYDVDQREIDKYLISIFD